MFEQFLHKAEDDKRSQNEILLSEKLTSKLTELNLKRINKNFDENKPKLGLNPDQISIKSQIKGKKALFICIPGIPPFPQEFQNFTFPGQMIKIIYSGFETGISEQERRERAYKSDLNLFSKQINDKINKFPSDYDLVFVCHSFGTFIASFYFKNFYEQQKDRIKGIIQFGGGPIRLYKVLEWGIKPSLLMTRQFIESNIDSLYGKFKDEFSKMGKGFPIDSYYSKYHIMTIFLAYKTERLNEIFEFARKMPKVLKLLVYGEKDYIFDKNNNDEKAIYFTYNPETQLDKEYAQKLSQKYRKIHSQTVKNIQQKFVFKISQGKHSLHLQKQLTPLLQKLIDDYLSVIF